MVPGDRVVGGKARALAASPSPADTLSLFLSTPQAVVLTLPESLQPALPLGSIVSMISTGALVAAAGATGSSLVDVEAISDKGCASQAFSNTPLQLRASVCVLGTYVFVAKLGPGTGSGGSGSGGGGTIDKGEGGAVSAVKTRTTPLLGPPQWASGRVCPHPPPWWQSWPCACCLPCWCWR